MTPGEQEGQTEMVVWKLEPEDAEPRWRIARWPDGKHFCVGPVIVPKDDNLVGMDWVNAATVEVLPASAVGGLYAALAELVRLKDGPRDDWYHQLKLVAWDRARELVAAYHNTQAEANPEEEK